MRHYKALFLFVLVFGGPDVLRGSLWLGKTVLSRHISHARGQGQDQGQKTHGLPPVCFMTSKEDKNWRQTSHLKLLRAADKGNVYWFMRTIYGVQDRKLQ